MFAILESGGKQYKVKEGDILETTFSQFAEEAGELFKPLIDERDKYMAARLQQVAAESDNQSILAVVGAGHLKGIEKYLSQAEHIESKQQLHAQAQQTIDEAKKAIEDGFIEANSKADKTLKLSNSDIFEVSIGKRVIASEIEQTENGIAVFSANVFEPFGYINKDVLENFDRPSVIWGIDGDWMVNYIKENKPFYPTDHCGVLRVKENEINPRYLTWLLDKAGQEIHFSRNHRASIDRIKGLTVNVPTIQVQDEIVTIIEKLEQKIKQAQTTIETAPRQKQQILDNYLN